MNTFDTAVISVVIVLALLGFRARLFEPRGYSGFVTRRRLP